MPARLMAAVFAAITLASTSGAAAVAVPAANDPDGTPIAEDAFAPLLIELPAKLMRLYLDDGVQDLDWLGGDEAGDAGLLGIAGEDGTTYRYLPPGSTSEAVSLAPLVATKSGLADYPLRERTTGTLGTSYTVVPESGTLELVSPVPAAALLFGSALSGLGTLAWRQRRRRATA
jgi:hypothetical protein